jgi:enoyl-CoA hydratase
MTDTTTENVRYAVADGVATLQMDDGKANAITHEMAGELNRRLDQAEADGARAVVLGGRAGRFCAGFDLATMQSGVGEARDLLRVGAELAVRLYTFPMPVVVAASGHSLAMGAILLMAADLRVGADGPFKIGLNEVRIGMPVPRFATELADDRLSRRHLDRAVNLATVYDPAGAVEAGFLDELVDPEAVDSIAHERAAALAADLHATPFAMTRQNRRSVTAARMRDGLSSDIEQFTIEGS